MEYLQQHGDIAEYNWCLGSWQRGQTQSKNHLRRRKGRRCSVGRSGFRYWLVISVPAGMERWARQVMAWPAPITVLVLHLQSESEPVVGHAVAVPCLYTDWNTHQGVYRDRETAA